MRIISGIYRHRLIEYPLDQNITRPTKDRIRESIFNALGDIKGKVCLDLYAGSGSMGLESLSREAIFCYFSDNSYEAIKCIKNNIKTLQIPLNYVETCYLDDESMIDFLIKRKAKVDIVFIDPPYQKGRYQEIVECLLRSDILNPHHIIVIEADHKLDIAFPYKKMKEYKHGDILVYIYWY